MRGKQSGSGHQYALNRLEKSAPSTIVDTEREAAKDEGERKHEAMRVDENSRLRISHGVGSLADGPDCAGDLDQGLPLTISAVLVSYAFRVSTSQCYEKYCPPARITTLQTAAENEIFN